jgi:ferredoxin-NADP reductase
VKLLLDSKETIADGVVLLSLRHPDGLPLPSWTPGAHVDLVLTDGLIRQYSLCGDPDDTSVMQVAVLREQAGRGGSRHVHDVLAAGQLIEVLGPRNHFPLVEAARYLFIAGGIGITPILPMIEQVAAAGGDWRLVYGGRTRASMAFRAELERRGNVEIRPQDEYGLLDLPALFADVDDDTAVYCCGPEPLLAAVEQHHTTGSLHVERFAPKAGATAGPRQEFEVELARTGGVLRVPADRSILEVLEGSGVPVLSGTPDHRDSLLTDDEQQQGDVMMICVSRARSDRLVLDL